jgi:proline racemase
MSGVFDHWDWRPPAEWLRISTVDMHSGGEPLRVLIAGLPQLSGHTVLDKRRQFREHYDYIRTGTMWEPRGHADMYGAVLTASADADFDVFFLHNEGYSTMCGHAIIALTTLVAETGLLRPMAAAGEATLAISFNVPAGRVQAHAVLVDGKAREVSFRNVPSFVYARNREIDVPGLGPVRFDIAYGGAFYVVTEAGRLGLQLDPQEHGRLIDFGRRIKQAVNAAYPVIHPFEPELSFLYGTIFTGPARLPGSHSRNACVFADGELDRSATGSGVSARVALQHAAGEVRVGEKLTIESILGTAMTVEVAGTVRLGDYPAVIPQVSGTAFVTGRSEFCFDPRDPLRAGFMLR